MAEMNALGTVEFQGAIDFAWPKIISLKIENVTYQGEWVEGDIALKYDLGGEKEVRQHVKTKINEEQSFDIGPLKAKFHVYLEGPKLWLALSLCLGPICTPELKTSVDLPQ